MPVLGRVKGGVAVAGVERPVAEEPVGRAVQVVGAALGDRVDHAPGRAAKLGAVAGSLHLKLLHRVLADVRTDAGAPGVLVVELERGVVAVLEERVGGGHPAKGNRPEGPVVGDARREQHKSIHPASIDGQVLNLAVVHHLGHAGLRLLHDGGAVLHADLLHLLANAQLHAEGDVLADLHQDLPGFIQRKALLLHRHCVTGGRRQRRGQKITRFVGHEFAADPLGLIGYGDLRGRHHRARFVGDRAADGAQASQGLPQEQPGTHEQKSQKLA